MIKHLARLWLLIAAFLLSGGAHAQVPLNLTAGWNLLGNSSNQVLTVSSPTLFGDPTRVNSVWMWDAINAIWLFYSPSLSAVDLKAYASSKGYRVLGQISPGDGYWVNAYKAFSVDAQISSSTMPTLVTGWNLVTTGSTVSPSTYAANRSAADITSIWAWDSSSSKWYFYAPTLDSNRTLDSYIASKGYLSFTQKDKLLGSGIGFWVNAVAKQPDPACNYAKPPVITYPPGYNGAFPIPTPNGRLSASIIRSIALKDFYPGMRGNQSIPKSSSCTDFVLYASNLYVEALNRLQQDGVDQVWIATYGDLNNLDRYGNFHFSVPESDVRLIVNEARKRNINVMLTNGYSEWNSGSKAELLAYLDSRKTRMLNLAQYAQQVGIAGLMLDGATNTAVIRNNVDLRELYVTKTVEIIDGIRNVYSGKLYYGDYTSLIDYRIISKIDTLALPLGAWSDAKTPLTVDVIRKAYLDSIKRIKEDFDVQMNGMQADIPIQWDVQVQSKSDYFSNGWSEDTYCVAVGDNMCSQLTNVTDFSVQAIGIEAAFQALTTQTYFRNGAVNFGGGYWASDDLVPTNYGKDFVSHFHPSPSYGDDFDFPNHAASFRNKPAENIVKYWFGRDGSTNDGYSNNKFVIPLVADSKRINLSFAGWFSSADNGRSYPVDIFLGSNKIATSSVPYDLAKSSNSPSGYWSDNVSLAIPIPTGSDLSKLNISMPANTGFVEIRKLSIDYFGNSVIDPKSATHSMGARSTSDGAKQPQWVYPNDVTTYDLTSLNLSQRTPATSPQVVYIDGGDGNDTVEFDPPQARGYFQITKASGLTVITDPKGFYPEIRMKNVEGIKFSDGTMPVQ